MIAMQDAAAAGAVDAPPSRPRRRRSFANRLALVGEVVRGGLIESIRPTVFDRFQFENAALVSNDAISVAASLTGKPFSELVKLDVVQLLRATL